MTPTVTNPTVTTPTVTTPTNQTTLKALPALYSGSVGNVVKGLQLIMMARGVPLPKCGADGDFGPETMGAVQTIQRCAGLPQTGRVDAATWAALVK